MLIWLLSIVAISLLVFGQAINGPFLFDDLAILRRHAEYAGELRFPLGPVGLRFFRHQVRALIVYERHLYHIVTRWLYFLSRTRRPDPINGGVLLRPWVWHGTNLLVHSANIVLFYGVVSTWWGIWPAAIGAAIFALHPIQTTSVCYISALPGMLAVFFTLCGLRHFQLGGWDHLLLAALAQFFACKSKQEGYVYAMLYPICFFWFG